MYSSSIYPVKINRYQPQQKPVQNNEKDGQSNSSAKQEQQERNYNTIYKPTPGYYGNKNFGQYTTPQMSQVHQQNSTPNESNPSAPKTRTNIMARQSFPNGEKTAIDYTQSKINISQVIKDFQNTTEAIGSPDDVKETVYTYISLVKKEAEKDSPNKKTIQSNLKNASQVLDEYITATLKKPSKVVEGWIDSLFLQNVDYKYDESIINPDYQVKIANDNKTETVNKPQPVQSEPKNFTQNVDTSQKQFVQKSEENPFYSLLVNAKREKNPAEALNLYGEIIENAKAENDSKSVAIAYFESGKLYDNFNSLDKAIENYSAAIENTDDEGMKAQAYLKMAQIRHDSADFKTAGEDYFSSIAYFGQVENPKAQAVVLSQAGKLVSEEYDKQKTQDYFELSNLLAQDIGDKSLIGKINQRAGEAFDYLNEPRTALSYYKDSASSYDEIQNNLGLARDYQAAAKLMYELGNTSKAKTLMYKAYKAGLKTDNQELIQNIQSQIAVLNAA